MYNNFYRNDVYVKNSIIIDLDANVPPMGFKVKNGNIVGFDVDLAKSVFSGFYEDIIFQTIDWNSKEMELNSRRIDVVWNGLSRTCKREETMLLTRPYLKNKQVVIVNQGSEISDLSDLKGKIVCVQKGPTGYDALKRSNISSQVSEIIELENMVNCLNKVELFKSDAIVVDELIAKHYLKGLNNKFKVLD